MMTRQGITRLIMALCCCYQAAWATSSFNGYGLVHLQHQDLQKVRIDGQLIACHLRAQHLRVQGHAELRHCQVTGKTAVQGYLTLHHSQIGSLQVIGQQLDVVHSQLASVTMQTTSENIPTIRLSQGSHVLGDVTFNSQHPGRVIADASSGVHGHIQHGTLTQEQA